MAVARSTRNPRRQAHDVEACDVTNRRTPLGAATGRSQASAPRVGALAQNPSSAVERASCVVPRGCGPASAGSSRRRPSSDDVTGRALMARRPGSSNTRALTPPDSAGRFPDGEALSQFRLIQCRVDALKIAYSVSLARTRELELAEALNVAMRCGGAISYVVAGTAFALEPRGTRDKTYRLRNDSATILAGDDRYGFCVVIEIRSKYLATNSIDDAIRLGWELAIALSGKTPDEERVRRIDLCADQLGAEFGEADRKNFVSRARTRVFHHPGTEHALSDGEALRYTGFCIGQRNDLSTRLYDKVAELRAQYQPSDEKRLIEEEAFRRAGWTDGLPVWRLEIQIRGKATQQLGLRIAREVPLKLNNVWAYAVGTPAASSANGWCRLVLPTTTRCERAPVDPRWLVFQQADFLGGDWTPVVRTPAVRGGAPLTHVLGSLRSYLAGSGRLPEVDGSAEEVLAADLAAFADVVAHEPKLLSTYLKRREGARARFASRDDGRVAPEGRGICAAFLDDDLDFEEGLG